MQLAPGHYVFVQTKSKLFTNSTSGHPEFIMSTHSIVRCVVSVDVHSVALTIPQINTAQHTSCDLT